MLEKSLVPISEVFQSGVVEAHYLCNEGQREGFDAQLASARLTRIAVALNENGPEPLGDHFDRLLKGVLEHNWRIALDTLQGCATVAQTLNLRGFEIPVTEELCFSGRSLPAGFR